jgi:hypothetical protein
VSPSKFDQLVAAGKLPRPIKFDGCVIWDIRRLDQVFDELMTEDAVNPWDDSIDSLQALPSSPDPLH